MTITIQEFKNLPNQDSYEVWDEESNQWVSFDDSCYAKTTSGFPKADEAKGEMLLITMFEKNEQKMYIWSRRPISDDNQVYDRFKNVELRVFEDERLFLEDFMRFMATTRIDILTGWNSESFDIPYVINRIKNVLGENFTKLISPWKIIKPRLVKDANFDAYTTYDIFGINHLDALDLYKKFNPGSKETFKLDNIAFEEIGERKVEIPVETFKESYAPEYWDLFVFYCCVDTHLVYKIDQKLDHTKLAMQLGFMAKCGFSDVLSAMRLWESIIYNHFNDQNMIEDFDKPRNEKESIIGAYVHEPKPGKYGWSISVDAESLYPSMMVQHNISPDVFVKMVDCSIEEILAGRIPKDFDPKTQVVSANGLVTSTEKQGFIPYLATRMGVLRKEAKKQMLKLKQEEQELLQAGVDSSDERILAKQKLAAGLDVKQKGLKTAANSFYGCCALAHFRYYDPRLAEAITSNGQVMIKKAMTSTNKIMNKICGTVDVEYVSYVDTDSVVGDSMVYANGKKVRIEDLYESCGEVYEKFDDAKRDFVKPVSDIKTLSFNTKTRQVEEKPIKYIMKHAVKKRMFRIKVGKEFVDVTEDHSVIVNRNGEYISVKPAEIIKTDKMVSIQTQLPVSVYERPKENP